MLYTPAFDRCYVRSRVVILLLLAFVKLGYMLMGSMCESVQLQVRGYILRPPLECLGDLIPWLRFGPCVIKLAARSR